MKRPFTGFLALLCLLSAVSAGWADQKSCAATHYKVFVIPLRPAAINQSGEVAGTSASHKAARWTQQKGLQELELPPGFTSAEATALNDEGQVVGIAVNLRTNRRQGFSFTDGKLSAFLDGARPLAINNAGDIAGESRISENGLSGPVFWHNLTPVSLGGCCGGTAVAINKRGQIMGNIYDQQGHYHAFLWQKAAGLQNIGPSAEFSSALLLNNSGHYLLQLFPSKFLLNRGTTSGYVSFSPKLPSHPKAINTCDVIVGSYGTFADDYRALIWTEAGGFRDLNELVPSDSGWILREATSINDRGEIVGWGVFRGAEDSGFLLSPQP